MISLKNNKVHIPTKWEDVKPEHIKDTVRIVQLCIEGKLDVFEMRLLLLRLYTGYRRSRRRWRFKNQENINSNLFLLSEKIRFPVKPVYGNPELLNVVSPKVRKRLQTEFPFEIFDIELSDQIAMIREHLKVGITVNFSMRKNPLPVLKSRMRKWYGPAFTIRAGDVQTDMLAEEFIDSLSYFRLYSKTGREEDLNTFVSVLYRKERGKYATFEAQANAFQFKLIAHEHKIMVTWWFQSVLDWLRTSSPYAIIFDAPKSENEKGYSNPASGIYSLSKAGYGSKKEISRLPLTDYLGMQVQQISDNVQQLRAIDEKDPIISEKLGIKLKYIQTL